MLFSIEPKVILNQTNSVPIGFYWVSKNKEISINEIVVFTPNKEIKNILEERFKLPKNNFLLKKVIASKGDSFCVSIDGLFTVNDKVYGIAKKYNSKGISMPQIRGCKKLSDDEYLVASNHPDSFDSRYFGTINRKQILGVAHPICLFDE